MVELVVERAGEHAADHVDDRQHAGEEHGRVSGGDRHDVGGQPEVGVEDGLQHLQGVAAAGEVVGDDEGDEPDRRRRRRRRCRP